jgi:hypothetical protein
MYRRYAVKRYNSYSPDAGAREICRGSHQLVDSFGLFCAEPVAYEVLQVF